jgi:heme exporter protein C
MSAVQEMPFAPTDAEAEREAAATPRRLNILTLVTVVATVGGLLMALFYAGTDVEQGAIQKIFYIHMPSFFGAFLAFGATVLGGIQYLRTRAVKWDTLALAGVEVGLVLALVNLATGSIWARPIWNTWWTWDSRLTSAAIMALTYAAYLMLRGAIDNPDTRRRFASVYGIVAISTVILTLVIIRLPTPTIHPAAIGPSPQNAQGEVGLTPSMRVTLLVNMVIWGGLIPVTLMWYRIRLQNFAERVLALKARVLSQ